MVTALIHALRERLDLTYMARVLQPGTVPKTETGKAKRLTRWADGDAPIPGIS